MEYTSKEVYEYVSRESNDPIVERKKCRVSWQDFPIYKSDLEFYDRVSPTFEVSEEYAKEFLERNEDIKDNFEYKDGELKTKIPTPTLCPEERCRKRYAFRNEKSLYKRKCSCSGNEIIWMFSPDKPYRVYENDFWRWDTWDPMDYWCPFNWKFDLIFKSLTEEVPVINVFVVWNDENSTYTNQNMNPKNCYLCFNSVNIEDCMYMREWEWTKSCINCDYVVHCENCCNCVQCFDSFNLQNCLYCRNCSFCDDCARCVNCNYCFNCYNLENKSYCINNKEYTKEEYEKLIIKAKKEPLEVQMLLWCSQKECENSFWNDITNCSNCKFVSESYNYKDVKYCNRELDLVDCMDLQWCYEQLTFEWISTTRDYNCWFIANWSGNKNIWYCYYCYDCSNVFWCVWLRNKSYCIYNKQYTKEEYYQIVPQIISQMIRDKEWWEFFDPQLSYFWYNESIAMDYYPLTKEEALKRWYKRSDYEAPFPKVERKVPWENLPKQWCRVIKEKKPEILEKILNYAIVCEVSKRPFRVTKQEIEFYVKHNLPLPTKHPDIRHQERLAEKDPVIMHLMNCEECWEEMLSVHEKWKWKKILCKKCFYKNK